MTINGRTSLGLYKDFRPVRRTMDDILAEARGDRAPLPVEPPVKLKEFDGVELVRYRRSSKAIDLAYEAMGMERNWHFDSSEMEDRLAVFGVIEKMTGKPAAVLVLADDRNNGGVRISVADIHPNLFIASGTMVEVLKALGVPPSRNVGADAHMIDRWDCWWVDGEWVARDPLHLVAVNLHRCCFGTNPVIEERIDFLFREDEDYRFQPDRNTDADFRALDHYRALAFEALGARPASPDGVRYSSWMTGDIRYVKVTSPHMYEDFSVGKPEDVASPAGP